MIPGFTDRQGLEPARRQVLGLLAPCKLPPGTAFAKMFHGVDERIPVAGFRWGTRVLFELVAELVA